MHRYRVEPGNLPHFCTCTVAGWIWVFSERRYFDLITQSLEYCRNNKGVLLNAYVIMPNHLHLILTAQKGISLNSVMRDFKRYTSRHISALLEEDKRHSWLRFFRRAAQQAGRPEGDIKVWQEEFHPEVLETERFFLQKLNYLHDNPVRKGFVDRPEHWLHSSARTYVTGERGVIDVDVLEWI